MSPRSVPENWNTCRDARHGFAFRYPPDWTPTSAEGTCVQLQKGQAEQPHGVPEVDVFIRVSPRHAPFPSAYLTEQAAGEHRLRRGVHYADRRELVLNGLPAVRARFTSVGPVPNWGVEYAVANEDLVLRIYISQPRPEVEAQFEKMMGSLTW
jgi:hypothetical protein